MEAGRILGLRRDALAVVAGITFVAALGGLATDIGPWYFALRQSAWKPPDAAFGPAWMLIYLCTGRALLVAWRQGDPAGRRSLQVAALLNGLINVAWSVLFFTLKRPDWSLVGSGLLLLSIGHLLWVCRAMTLGSWKPRVFPLETRAESSANSPRAATGWRALWNRPVILLLPYAVWVSLATTINAGVVALNGPFA